MADDLRPIVIKRVKKAASGHHGGSWKIAYADFVTAMMAFFLLMWLLSSVSKGDLGGIAEFFSQPLRVALSGGDRVGDATSIVKGGGTDLSRKDGQQSRGDDLGLSSRPKDLKKAQAELERLEKEKLEGLKARLDASIDANKVLRMFKRQLLLDLTSEGLRIQIVDEQHRPMFDLASAELKPYTREILTHIGSVLNEVPNRISLSGHTDAKPFASGDRGYSNWELSADRANASRRALVLGGMDESKVLRVVGLASSIMMDKSEPENPINRRISIVVMNKRTEDAILQQSGNHLDAKTSSELETGLQKKLP
ncbi:MAG: flagellar motor protein MotB [Burkholderiaceae bacterium]|jgi:chemotaxis protein MotB|nr:flagellar motor protein MotB [Burkholderiaceae bacterium]